MNVVGVCVSPIIFSFSFSCFQEAKFLLTIYEGMNVDLLSRAKGRNTLFTATLEKSEWVARTVYQKEHVFFFIFSFLFI